MVGEEKFHGAGVVLFGGEVEGRLSAKVLVDESTALEKIRDDLGVSVEGSDVKRSHANGVSLIDDGARVVEETADGLNASVARGEVQGGLILVVLGRDGGAEMEEGVDEGKISLPCGHVEGSTSLRILLIQQRSNLSTAATSSIPSVTNQSTCPPSLSLIGWGKEKSASDNLLRVQGSGCVSAHGNAKLPPYLALSHYRLKYNCNYRHPNFRIITCRLFECIGYLVDEFELLGHGLAMSDEEVEDVAGVGVSDGDGGAGVEEDAEGSAAAFGRGEEERRSSLVVLDLDVGAL